MEVFSGAKKGRECLTVQMKLGGPHTAVKTPNASGDPCEILPERSIRNLTGAVQYRQQ
jgi:hypothetical protein